MIRPIRLFMLAALLFALAPSAQAGLIDGLQAYWDFDGVGTDRAGTHDLTASGGADFVAGGVVGQAGRGNESTTVDSLHTVTLSSDLGISNAYTISGWYQIGVLGGGGEKSSFSFLSQAGYRNVDDNDNYNVDHQTNSAKPTITTDIGVWYHVVQRFNGTNVEFFHTRFTESSIGGNTLSIADSTAVNLNGVAFRTAYYESKGTSSAGRVLSDEVAIWNRALNNQELDDLFLLGKSGEALAEIPEPTSAGFLLLITGVFGVARRRARG